MGKGKKRARPRRWGLRSFAGWRKEVAGYGSGVDAIDRQCQDRPKGLLAIGAGGMPALSGPTILSVVQGLPLTREVRR